jgi:hypothetical protein
MMPNMRNPEILPYSVRKERNLGHTVRWLAYLYSNGMKVQSTKRYTIVAKSFDLLQNIFPEVNYRKPPRMEFASVQEDTLAAHEQRMLVPSYLFSDQMVMVEKMRSRGRTRS